MAMNFKEIVDSEYFYHMMRFRVKTLNDIYDEGPRQLMYEMCSTMDERISATRRKIIKLKEKIQKSDTAILCLDYINMSKIMDQNDMYYGDEMGFKITDPCFWEDYFTDYFFENINSLTPMTDYIAGMGKEMDQQQYNKIHIQVLEWEKMYSRDRSLVVKAEEEIMQRIESEIEGIDKGNGFIFNFECFTKYIQVSYPLAYFFKISDSLILLRRLRKYQRIHEEDLKEMEFSCKTVNKPYMQSAAHRQKENDLTPEPSGGDISRKMKTTTDYLIGNEQQKSKILEYIKKIYSGEKGKSIAIMILALKEARMICYDTSTKLYLALRNDFGNIGTNAGINKQMTDVRLMDKELMKTISLHAEKLRKHMEAV